VVHDLVDEELGRLGAEPLLAAAAEQVDVRVDPARRDEAAVQSTSTISCSTPSVSSARRSTRPTAAILLSASSTERAPSRRGA
jgi:hypothetical protein